MGYGTIVTGQIDITPEIPAELLASSRFRSREAAWKGGAELFIDTTDTTSDAVIVTTSEEEHGSRDGVRAALKDIVELLGDGYTYDGEFKGDGDDCDGFFSVTVEDGRVVEHDGTVVYGLGPIGSQLSGRDIETALATLAELWVTVKDDDDLSSRQWELGQLLHGLWGGDNDDNDD